MNDWKTHLAVLVLFVALTFLMTYPLILNPVTKVRSPGDTLLNTWVVSWDVHKILSLDFKHFFDANIFYPYKRTLAYSEHLFPQALLALPVLVASGNPLLAYNVLFFFAFITSGFGMYLLARHLTGNSLAALIAGMIYAFPPFMVSHEVHLQVLTAGGIPLAFLFLHRFFERERLPDLSLFGLFFLLQGLANGYYFLYLSFVAGIFILYQIISKKKYGDFRFLAKLVLVGLVVSVLAGPFFYEYVRVRKEMGFVRKSVISAEITSFLAVPRLNRLYGAALSRYRGPEAELFPGIIPLCLAGLGIVLCLRKRGTNNNDPPANVQAGRKEFLRKRNPASKTREMHCPGFYLATLILAFLFVFGTRGPYNLLFRFVPGFDGLRVAARWNIFIGFSLAVFAAFGMRSLLRRLKGIKKKLAGIGVALLILLEYLSIPMPVATFPIKKNIPRVYSWLAEKRGEDFALVELPLQEAGKSIATVECPRMYYSIYHWKSLVNGYSGYFPFFYIRLKDEWPRLPMALNIARLKEIGVRYLIVHSKQYTRGDLKRLRKQLDRLPGEVGFVARVDEAEVYELIYPPGERDRIFASPRTPLPAKGPPPRPKKSALPQTGFNFN